LRAPARSHPCASTHRHVTFNLTTPSWTSATADQAILLVLVLTGRRRAEVISPQAGDLSLKGETAYYQCVG
jgi:hypothetical protein